MKALCDIFQVNNVNMTLYHPQSNGLHEQTTRRLLHLQSSQFTLNVNIHSSIGMSRHCALRGISARSPFDVLPEKVGEVDETLRTCVTKSIFYADFRL